MTSLVREGRKYEYSEWLDFECEGREPSERARELAEEFTERAVEVATSYLRSQRGPEADPVLAGMKEDAFAWNAYASIVGHGVGLWEEDGDTGLPGEIEGILDAVVKKDKKLRRLADEISMECAAPESEASDNPAHARETPPAVKRRRLVEWANDIGKTSRRAGAPTLAIDSPREQILRWLLWNDPNGIYTDDRNRQEGRSPDEYVTLDEAWELLEGMYDEDYDEKGMARSPRGGGPLGAEARWGRRSRYESPRAQAERERREKQEREKAELQTLLQGYDVGPFYREDPATGERLYVRPDGETETVKSFAVGEHPYHGVLYESIVRDRAGTLYWQAPGAMGFVYAKLTPKAGEAREGREPLGGESRERGKLVRVSPDPGRHGMYHYTHPSQRQPIEIWVSGSRPTWATVRFRSQEKTLEGANVDEALAAATEWIDAAPELARETPQGGEPLPNPTGADLWIKIGTLSHNRAFSMGDFVEYTGRSELELQKLVRKRLIRKAGGSEYYPTPEGWKLIEAAYGATENPRVALPNPTGDILWIKIGTLSHNRDFSMGDFLEYTGRSEGELRKLVRKRLLRKEGRGRYYPTPEGWKLIEAAYGTSDNPRVGEPAEDRADRGQHVVRVIPARDRKSGQRTWLVTVDSRDIGLTFETKSGAERHAEMLRSGVAESPRVGEPAEDRADRGQHVVRVIPARDRKSGQRMWLVTVDSRDIGLTFETKSGADRHAEMLRSGVAESPRVGEPLQTSDARSNGASRSPPAARESAESTELLLYANNTSELYAQKKAIRENLAKKMKKGTYDPELAAKAWMYWLESAAKRYVKEFGGGAWHAIFPMSSRLEAARELEQQERAELEIELTRGRQELGPRGARDNPVTDVSDALPWVKISRDPERYKAALKDAAAIGPIDDAGKIFELLGPALLKEDQETFIVVLLDVRQQCRGVAEVHRGSRSRVGTSLVDVLRVVIASGAEGFVVVHNHPSGKASPSEADKELTDAIEKAARVFDGDISFVDHVVIGAHEYYSFADKKLYKAKGNHDARSARKSRRAAEAR